MTGEMSQFDADHGEEWALHRSIARAIGGKVRAFDVYQGPYISILEGRLWVIPQDARDAYLWLEDTAPSETFQRGDTRRACRLARKIVAFTTAAHRLRDRKAGV